MPWFVCPTSCSNEDYNGNADHALVYNGYGGGGATPYDLLRLIETVVRVGRCYEHTTNHLYKLVFCRGNKWATENAQAVGNLPKRGR